MEPTVARTARMVVCSTSPSSSWIRGIRAASSTISFSVPSLKTRSSRRWVAVRKSSSMLWNASATWPISATRPSPGTAAGLTSAVVALVAAGAWRPWASRATWSTMRRKTTKPSTETTRARSTKMSASVCLRMS